MKEKIRTLQIIHLAICGGVLLVYILIGNISVETLYIPPLDSPSNMYLVIPFLALAIGNFLFYSQLKRVDKNLKPEDNFSVYQTASILRWAILEGAAFVILFLAPEYLIFGLFLILIMVFLRPTEARVKAALQYLD